MRWKTYFWNGFLTIYFFIIFIVFKFYFTSPIYYIKSTGDIGLSAQERHRFNPTNYSLIFHCFPAVSEEKEGKEREKNQRWRGA